MKIKDIQEVVNILNNLQIRTSRGKVGKYFKKHGFDRNNFVTGYNIALKDIEEILKEITKI